MKQITSLEGFAKELELLSSKKVDLALSRAINKTMRTLKHQAALATSKDLQVKLKLIKQRLYEAKANTKRLEARLTAYLYDLPAVILKTRQTKAGMYAGKHFYKSAFLAKAKKGKLDRRVFRRLRQERFPIKEMKINVEDAMKVNLSYLAIKVQDIFYKHVKHEVNYLLKGM